MADEHCIFCHHTVKSSASFCPQCNHPLILLNRYRLVRQIGKGGFATVFETTDMRLHQRRCVAKVIKRTDLALEPQILSRYASEFDFIPDIYDISSDGATTSIIMEYIEGESLDRTDLPWSAKDVEAFLDAMLKNLSALHKAGVIHRDLKPANIIRRRRDRRLFILDFGISKQDSGTPTIVKIAGSLDYASPEQMTGAPSDFRSDLYGLGATAYELLTGTTPTRSLDRRAGAPVVPPRRKRRGDVPLGLQSVILRLMALNPDKRPEDALAALNLLNQYTKSFRWRLINVLQQRLDNVLAKYGPRLRAFLVGKLVRKIPILGSLPTGLWRSRYVQWGLALMMGVILSCVVPGMLGLWSVPSVTPTATVTPGTVTSILPTSMPVSTPVSPTTGPTTTESATGNIRTVTSNALNVRELPGADNNIAIIARLYKDEQVTLLGKSDVVDGITWVYIHAKTYKGEDVEGWVNLEFLE